MADVLFWAVALMALQDFHLHPSISQTGTPGSAGETALALLMAPINPLTLSLSHTHPIT